MLVEGETINIGKTKELQGADQRQRKYWAIMRSLGQQGKDQL